MIMMTGKLIDPSYSLMHCFVSVFRLYPSMQSLQLDGLLHLLHPYINEAQLKQIFYFWMYPSLQTQISSFSTQLYLESHMEHCAESAQVRHPKMHD